jgi:hypothetical protein
MPAKRGTGRGLVQVEDARALRDRIHDLLRTKNQTVFTSIPDHRRWWLAGGLTHACLRAQFGLHIEQGSRMKRAAWTLDIFTFDVCHALWRAGVPVIADPDPDNSHAQLLAKELSALLGLPGHESTNFYAQMRRARHFMLESEPDGGIAEAWLDGRLGAENLPTVETIAPGHPGRADGEIS